MARTPTTASEEDHALARPAAIIVGEEEANGAMVYAGFPGLRAARMLADDSHPTGPS